MTFLHIDSSILGEQSVSRQLSKAIVSRLMQTGDEHLIYRDLAATPLSHLTGAHLATNSTAEASESIALDLRFGETMLEEFLAASIVVVGTGFYNFGIPSQLKAWIDRIIIVGRTFRYGPDGRAEGLAGDKRVILAIARGGFYGSETTSASFEHAESYLRVAFGFIGITNVEVIAAEGMAVSPEHREAGIATAQEQIAALALTA